MREQTDGGKAAYKNVASGVSAGAVGGGEARTAVLSGHQWARRFVTTAFLMVFAGGMLGSGRARTGLYKMEGVREPASSLGSWLAHV